MPPSRHLAPDLEYWVQGLSIAGYCVGRGRLHRGLPGVYTPARQPAAARPDSRRRVLSYNYSRRLLCIYIAARLVYPAGQDTDSLADSDPPAVYTG